VDIVSSLSAVSYKLYVVIITAYNLPLITVKKAPRVSDKVLLFPNLNAFKLEYYWIPDGVAVTVPVRPLTVPCKVALIVYVVPLASAAYVYACDGVGSLGTRPMYGLAPQEAFATNPSSSVLERQSVDAPPSVSAAVDVG